MSGKPISKSKPKSRAAQSWQRTVLAAVSLGALLVSSLTIGDYLWFSVVGRTAAFFVYLAWMGIILAAAAGIASLAVRVFFPTYDERLSARRPAPMTEEEAFLEMERSGAAFQPLTVYYALLMVAASVGAMFIAQNLSGGALFAFKVVQMEAMSRSEDPAELRTFLAEVEELQQPEEVIRFVEKLPHYYGHQDESIREAAFKTTEVMAHRMNLSVYLLQEEGQLLGGRWEPELLSWMHEEIGPSLRQLARAGVSPMPALVAALARLARLEDNDFFLSLARQADVADATFAQAAIGLGNLALFESASPLIAAIPNRSGPARIRIFWALERVGNALREDITDEDQEARVLEQVESLVALMPQLDGEGKCGTVMAIKAFQHSGAIDALIDLFDSPDSEFTCPRVELREPVGPPMVYVHEDHMQWLLLNAMAEIGAGNARLRSWLTQALEKEYDPRVMKGLRQLHGQLLARPETEF